MSLSTDIWKGGIWNGSVWNGGPWQLSGFPAVDVPSSEADALIRFYNATDGDNWTTNTGWCTDTTVGNWYGVTVSGGHVTRLDFGWSSNNLNGDAGMSLTTLTLNKFQVWTDHDFAIDIANLPNFTAGGSLILSTTSGYGNVSDLPSTVSLITCRVANFDFAGQNISDIPSGHQNYGIENTGISGDVADLIDKITALLDSFWCSYNSNITYTSTTMPAFKGQVHVHYNSWSETEVNTFIQDLDTGGGTGGTLLIHGTNAAPGWGTELSPSDTALAVASLLDNGWTITVTASETPHTNGIPDWVLAL